MATTAAMTSKERLCAAMAGKAVDRVPFAPFLAYFWEAQPPAVREAGQLAFLQQVGADPIWRCSPGIAAVRMPGVTTRTTTSGDRTQVRIETPVGSLSEVYQNSAAGNTRYLVEHAVRSAEDFKALAWIEEHSVVFADAAPMREHFAGNGREGLSLGTPIHARFGGLKTAFQALVEHWVGTEQLIYTLMDQPQLVDLVLEPMQARNREAVNLSAAVDEYEYFMTFEDSSTQNYSPRMYADFIAPEIGAWQVQLATAGKQYVQHACGHVKGIVTLMRDQRIWGIESLTPPHTGDLGIAEARSLVGGDFGIIGGIEPVAFEALGVEQLPEYVEQILAENAGGRFVLANSDSCPPGVEPIKFKVVADCLKTRPAKAR